MYDGRGFHIVRGIDPKEYNEEQNLLLFAGISSHVAPARSHTIGKAPRELVRRRLVDACCQDTYTMPPKTRP